MDSHSHASKSIYLKLVLTAFFWGGTWVAARILVQEVPPFAAAFYRFVVATLATAWFASRNPGQIRALKRHEWLTAVLMGLTGIFAYNYFFLHGLKYIAAGRGALVVALNPIVVALTAWAFFGERMVPLKAAGIVIALAGCLFVITNGHPQALLSGGVGIGEVLIFGCVICWTFYTFIGRRATRTLSPVAANLYGCITGCAMLGAAAFGEGSLASLPAYSPTSWLCIVYLGFFGTALSYTWFTEGVRQIGAARTAAFINLVPVSGVLLGALILGERLHPAALLGGALTIAGVVLTNRAITSPARA